MPPLEDAFPDVWLTTRPIRPAEDSYIAPTKVLEAAVKIILGLIAVLAGLVIVVVIGIVAAIAIPKFASTKEKAYLAAVKSDLRTFVSAQDSYFGEHGTYGTSTDLETAELFHSAPNVQIVSTNGNATGYSATASHADLRDETCGVFVGDATRPHPSVTTKGEVGCW